MSDQVFNHTAHKAFWNWLSKNPTKGKEEWPGWEENGGSLDCGNSYCFACEYAMRDGRVDCGGCPLMWPKGAYSVCEDDIYGDWCSARDRGSYQVASLLAEEIRDLPVKPGVRCK